MRNLCPVCSGKGTVNDPTVHRSMGYCGPNGELWPQIRCQNCGGSGWIGLPDGGSIPPKRKYAVELRAKNIIKAEARVIEPEGNQADRIKPRQLIATLAERSYNGT